MPMKTVKLAPLVTFKYFKPDDSQLNLLKQSVNTLLIHPREYPELYTQFYEDLDLFLSKVSNSAAKSAVKELTNRKLIYIVRHLSSRTKSGIFGGCFFNNNKLV